MEKTTQIESLTQEQIDTFPHYVKKWLDIGLSTTECDVESSKLAIVKAYEVADLPPPEYFIGPVNHPIEMSFAESILKEFLDNRTKFRDNDHLNEMVMEEVQNRVERMQMGEKINIDNSGQIYGCHEFWLSFYNFFQEQCKLDICNKLQGLMDLSKVCGWWTPMENIAILSHKPLKIHMDEQNRTHNINGPAIKFRGNDLCDVYIVHGVRVTKKVVDRNYTVDDIDKEPNAEVRRVMIELYGQSKYLMDSNAKEIHSDDFGTLYLKEIPDDEPLMMVKVVNSTPEEDGSFKDYFIRVDPNAYGGLKTGLAAVASTWRNPDGSMVFERPEEYDPIVQT